MSVQETHEPSTKRTGTINAETFNAVARHFVQFGNTVSAEFTDTGLELWGSRFQNPEKVDEDEEPAETAFLEATIPKDDWESYPGETERFAIDSWSGLYKALTGSLPDTITVSVSDTTVTIHETTTQREEPVKKVDIPHLNLPTKVEVTHGNLLREWISDSNNAEFIRVALSEQFGSYDAYKLSLRNAGEIENPDRVDIETKTGWRVSDELNPLGEISLYRNDCEQTYEEVEDGSTIANINFAKKSHFTSLFAKTLKRHTESATYTIEFDSVYPFVITRDFDDIGLDTGATMEAIISPFKRESIDGEELDWKF